MGWESVHEYCACQFKEFAVLELSVKIHFISSTCSLPSVRDVGIRDPE
jgi:hypothetical protein